MKILLEQDFDLDAALSGGKTTTVVEPVLPNNPPPVNPAETPPPVEQDTEIHNDDPQTTLGRHLAENGSLIQKLIINAIYFNREIASATKALDIDETEENTEVVECFEQIYRHSTGLELRGLFSTFLTPCSHEGIKFNLV